MSAKANASAKPATPITRADIEAKFGELRGEVDEQTEAVKVPAIAVAVGVAVVTVVVAYWLGKAPGQEAPDGPRDPPDLTCTRRSFAGSCGSGLRKGMSGSTPWMIVGIVAGGLRVLRPARAGRRGGPVPHRDQGRRRLRDRHPTEAVSGPGAGTVGLSMKVAP